MDLLLDEWRETQDNNFVVGGVFMDLYRAVGCIPQNLLIAKLEAYGLHDNLVCNTYSYLDNRKQWVEIINKKSSAQN